MANSAAKDLQSPALKGILFDMDGTLIDSLGYTFEAFNYALTTLGERTRTPEEIMEHFGAGEDDIFAALLGAEKAPKAFEVYQRYADENVHRIPLHAGVPELLERLKSASVPISIVTGRSWPLTEIILKYHRLLDRFITVVADDHVGQPKPSPEGLHLALSRMKLEPEQTLFVGDSPMDMLAARRAGSHGVGALWDLLSNRELLSVHSPRHWAEKPEDVWDIFGR